MSTQEETYLTPEGQKKLKAELKDLVGPQRVELAERLRSAIQMGDLSENADYHKAKEDQAFLEGQIQELKYILSNAVIIEDDGKPKNVVSVGASVTIQEEDYPAETYYLVGAKEADPRNGKISNASPIGSALLNHRVGDVVEADAPGGTLKLKILKIE
ncbi:MAG: transcription elongation factor GreA [Anaerolineae bacterium]|jgi:transcription elongation factor GreA|nr:transcription elongation factor GreA [Anaerolineae bacterium]MBT3714228.1 transcription elongation factor GreA [Anaerolineae bacterium]MBT4309081.1 transcription elongation factor GreA [Anaerolineae bacterium]MBT4457560.1 transcription elongation factor GreA [Anaerolineae bacterium]MBT4840843.1 transcription elongation factor GreA [Anaerolineae bacterium]